MNTQEVEQVWIQGCAQLIREYKERGWSAYYINFMFEPILGSPSAVVEDMKKAIHKEFYTPFMMRFVRDPHRQREQERMPRLLLYPDKPVAKRVKASIHEVRFNGGGLHFNGLLLIPPVSRFRECPIEHIDENQGRYTRGHIERIHIEPLDHRHYRVADYSAKTVKWHRADEADILILPKPISEVKHGALLSDADQKAIKDIQSALNVSEELARQKLRVLETYMLDCVSSNRMQSDIKRYNPAFAIDQTRPRQQTLAKEFRVKMTRNPLCAGYKLGKHL
ncbi:MAG: hypothetical protein K2Y71_15750 [Xanthobacteraceae bacterium]|nr:hypothetical protein [Xanthobacteraceae bacterium]